MNNRTICTSLSIIGWWPRRSTQKYRQSAPYLRPKTQGPSILHPRFVVFLICVTVLRERSVISIQHPSSVVLLSTSKSCFINLDGAVCCSDYLSSLLVRNYGCTHLSAHVEPVGLSVVPIIFPCHRWETMDVHTSRHMLNQSVTVLANYPVRVVTVHGGRLHTSRCGNLPEVTQWELTR